MALKIRMRQQGRRNRLFYRLVVTANEERRDGKYVECIGWYNPFESTAENSLHLKADRLSHWLDMGAQLSEKAEHLAVQAAPAVMKSYKEKKDALKAKKRLQKRERRKKVTASE